MHFPEYQTTVWKTDQPHYPETAPFHPDTAYPEYAFDQTSTEQNIVYDGIREIFRISNLDAENCNTPSWNPLKGFIKEGDTVLLKPNLVKEFHPRDPEGWKYVLTHGSVIRAVADFIFKALNGTGKILLGDAPQTDSSFSKIVKILKLDEITSFYQQQGLNFQLIDFRKEEWVNDHDVIVKRTKLQGDPNGYIAFDLSDRSEFHGHSGIGKYYGADYDAGEVNSHHDGHKNEYLITGSAIKCDVYFNLPKLKTHKKAGVTINLKNLVGVNGDKNWLPHHTEGDPSTGGDQFPRMTLAHSTENSSVKLLKKAALAIPGIGPKLMKAVRPIGKKLFGDTEEVVRSGNWYGNDTVWRMCLDLNKLVLYGNPDGSLRLDIPENRKRYYCLVDGVIGGEGRGPMNPDPHNSGLLLFGTNPVVTDTVGAMLMGFDTAKIPIIKNAFTVKHFKLTHTQHDDILIVSNVNRWNKKITEFHVDETMRYQPHFGWVGHIEAEK